MAFCKEPTALAATHLLLLVDKPKLVCLALNIIEYWAKDTNFSTLKFNKSETNED